MAIEVLLIEDVVDLGRSGEVHRVAPGYARNFLFPRGFALVADKNTLRKQEKLKLDRAKRAEADRQEAEKLAGQLAGKEISCVVKVDPTGQMYGSVSTTEIIKLFEEQGIYLEKHTIHPRTPFKTTGTHTLSIVLKEGVACETKLHIIPETQV